MQTARLHHRQWLYRALPQQWLRGSSPSIPMTLASGDFSSLVPGAGAHPNKIRAGHKTARNARRATRRRTAGVVCGTLKLPIQANATNGHPWY